MTGASFAQSGDNGARVILEQTDQLIDYATPIIRDANDPIALDVLARSTDLQAKAWEAFNRGAYGVAKKLSLEARKLLRTALTNSKQSENQEGTVQRRLERAEEQLELAQQAIADAELPRLQSLYQVARNSLDRAWEFYRSEKYRPAIKLADQVERTAGTILDAARGADRIREQYIRREATVIDLVARGTDAAKACSSEAGKTAAEQAEKNLQLAQELNTAGKAAQALKALQTARDLAQKAIRECGGTAASDLSRVSQRYEALKGDVDRLAEPVTSLTGDTGTQARALLDQARELLAKAKMEIEAGNLSGAEASLQAAHLAIDKVDDYIGATH